jgi:Predicted thioesterase
MKNDKGLSIVTGIAVRFSEVDSLGMVWHGNYVKYLEDGREAFGRKYGLEYTTIYAEGYYTPVVELNMEYRSPATIDDNLEVRTVYMPQKAAKLVYEYEMRNKADGRLILTATSVQLIVSAGGTFEPSKPEFFRNWESKYF